jgi:SAM-dependent methyltransferase
MTEPSFDDRRLSFGSGAADYAELRPTYPRGAVQWVLDGASRPVDEVADVGAGTGALTAVLVDLVDTVIAYEPDPGMLAELAHRLPGVEYHEAYAESLPISDDSFDAVLCGQAWHWFDKAAAADEFQRVVRTGGVIGLLWNIRDDHVDWMHALSDLVGGEDSMRASRENAQEEIEEVLSGVERREFAHTHLLTPDEIVGLVSTFSYVRLSPRATEVYAGVRELLATHPDTAGLDRIPVPYVTAAYRVLSR